MSNFEARQDNTCEGIVAWPVFFDGDKKVYEDGSSVIEWRGDLIIEDTPENAASIDNLYAMASEAAIAEFGSDRNKWPTLNQAVRQTSEKANNPQTGRPWEGYEHGKLFISCASIYRPPVIHQEGGRTIINPDEVFGGCKAIYCVKARAYNNKSKGVKFTLVAVMITANGKDIKPFGGDRPDPAQIFKPLIKAGAGAQGQVAAPAGVQPTNRRQL